MAESAVCPECGKRVRVGVPRGGDGSVGVLYRHDRPDGTRCPGGRRQVEWRDTEGE